MGQIERLLAALSVLLVFVYVVLRAIYVPTFHDEAATFFHYIVSENFLPFQAHWDANNHILNSALGFLFYKVLGPQQWWIRLPNVLSFLVFGYFTIRISEDLKNGWVRWGVLIAVLTATFLLEFFSLARGYAMSIAFLMGVIHHGALYFKTYQLKHQFLLWFWMWLAVAASLTLMNSYLIALGLVLLTIVLKRESVGKHLLVWFGVGISFFLAAAYYSFQLKERGLLYTGLADGFIEVTVRSLVRYQLDRESQPISVFITALGGISAIWIIGHFLMKSLKWNAIRLAAVFLLLNAIGSILLNLLFGMNFPENRVGMYYIPLFLFSVGGALDLLSGRIPQAKWLVLSFLIFPAHLVKHFGFDSTILWPKWHASDKIYNKALNLQRSAGEPLMISAEYLNELGWAYYNFQNHSEMQLLQRDPVPDTLADMLVARPADFDFSSIPYDTLFHDPPNDVYLLGRRNQINWGNAVKIPLVRPEFSGTDEFYEIANSQVSELPGHRGTWELKGQFNTSGKVFRGQLIIISETEDGGGNSYNMIPLHWLRPVWNGEELHVKRTFHFAEHAKGFKIYFWNFDKQEISFKLENLEFRAPS